MLFLFAFGLEAMPFGEKEKKKKEREDRGEPVVGSLPSLIGHKERSFWSCSSSRGKKERDGGHFRSSSSSYHFLNRHVLYT